MNPWRSMTFQWLAAVVAGVGVDVNLAVHHFRGLDGAVLLHLTDLAAPALGVVHHGHPLAHDAQIVQVRLDAVVGAAAHGNLELVGQGHAVVANVELLVNLLAQAVGVDEAVLAGGALAGDHGAHQAAGAAGHQAVLAPSN